MKCHQMDSFSHAYFYRLKVRKCCTTPIKNNLINVGMNKGIVNVSEDRGWNKVPNFSYHT